jgi:hypothetical protein
MVGTNGMHGSVHDCTPQWVSLSTSSLNVSKRWIMDNKDASLSRRNTDVVQESSTTFFRSYRQSLLSSQDWSKRTARRYSLRASQYIKPPFRDSEYDPHDNLTDQRLVEAFRIWLQQRDSLPLNSTLKCTGQLKFKIDQWANKQNSSIFVSVVQGSTWLNVSRPQIIDTNIRTVATQK